MRNINCIYKFRCGTSVEMLVWIISQKLPITCFIGFPIIISIIFTLIFRPAFLQPIFRGGCLQWKRASLTGPRSHLTINWDQIIGCNRNSTNLLGPHLLDHRMGTNLWGPHLLHQWTEDQKYQTLPKYNLFLFFCFWYFLSPFDASIKLG